MTCQEQVVILVFYKQTVLSTYPKNIVLCSERNIKLKQDYLSRLTTLLDDVSNQKPDTELVCDCDSTYWDVAT